MDSSLKTILRLILLIPFYVMASPGLGSEKPNIVFIFADDWGWGDLSCHGNEWQATPNIDRLAREGIDFQNFHVLSPVCSPSRVASMTGRFPARFGINTVVFNDAASQPNEMPSWLDPTAPMLPRLLKQAGYRTGHFGKWHMGLYEFQDSPKMSDYGIDESACYHGPGPKIKRDEIGLRAAEFIRSQKGGRPFFLNVWLNETHLTHSPSAESMERFKHLDEQKQVYAAVVADGDNDVGLVIEALEEIGELDNTIIIFSSDNGPAETAGPNQKGEPGKYRGYYSVGETGGFRGQKASLFEGGTRVPFIVRWPGHAPAGVVDEKTDISTVDLLPTLCAAAGVPIPDDLEIDGENLLDAIRGNATRRSRALFWKLNDTPNISRDESKWPRLAMLEGDWKLVMTSDGARRMLIHLGDDRFEQVDLSAEHPEIVADLSERLSAWNAELPTKPDPRCLTKETAPSRGREQ